MSIKITGLDEVLANLQQLQDNAEALHGRHDVPFTELFLDPFMTKYTEFPTMQAMIDASSQGDSEDFSGNEWNAFVTAHTQFASWEEMQQKAGDEWAVRKMGF